MSLPSRLCRTSLEEPKSLVLGIDKGVGHGTAILNTAIGIGIHHANWCRAAWLFVRLCVLLPFEILSDPIDGVFPKDGTWFIAVVNIKYNVIAVEVTVRIAALASGEARFLRLSSSDSLVHPEVLNRPLSVIDSGVAVQNLINLVLVLLDLVYCERCEITTYGCTRIQVAYNLRLRGRCSKNGYVQCRCGEKCRKKLHFNCVICVQ